MAPLSRFCRWARKLGSSDPSPAPRAYLCVLGITSPNHRTSRIMDPQFYPLTCSGALSLNPSGQCEKYSRRCAMHLLGPWRRDVDLLFDACFEKTLTGRALRPSPSQCSALEAPETATWSAARGPAQARIPPFFLRRFRDAEAYPIDLRPGMWLGHPRNTGNVKAAGCIGVGFMFGWQHGLCSGRLTGRDCHFLQKEDVRTSSLDSTFLGHCLALMRR